MLWFIMVALEEKSSALCICHHSRISVVGLITTPQQACSVKRHVKLQNHIFGMFEASPLHDRTSTALTNCRISWLRFNSDRETAH